MNLEALLGDARALGHRPGAGGARPLTSDHVEHDRVAQDLALVGLRGRRLLSLVAADGQRELGLRTPIQRGAVGESPLQASVGQQAEGQSAALQLGLHSADSERIGSDRITCVRTPIHVISAS